jgi:hypothetical protein
MIAHKNDEHFCGLPIKDERVSLSRAQRECDRKNGKKQYYFCRPNGLFFDHDKTPALPSIALQVAKTVLSRYRSRRNLSEELQPALRLWWLPTHWRDDFEIAESYWNLSKMTDSKAQIIWTCAFEDAVSGQCLVNAATSLPRYDTLSQSVGPANSSSGST